MQLVKVTQLAVVENSPHLHINLPPQDPGVKFLEVVGAFANVILTRPQLGGLSHLERFTWQITTPVERVTVPGRSGRPSSLLRQTTSSTM